MASMTCRLNSGLPPILADLQTVIRAVYKQVLGNPHVMESERLVALESQLCDSEH